MLIREATPADIAQLQVVRHTVKENVLSDPSRVTDNDCEEFIIRLGKGWVCVSNNFIVGFSIVDLVGRNIWALFMRPEYEKQGIGKRLHDTMLDWYFSQTQETVWLGTSPHTRAAFFYAKAGWENVGTVNKGEVKFEMTSVRWSELTFQRMA